VTLLGRLLNAAYFSSSGYEQIRRWTMAAERDESLRAPLSLLMADVAAESGESQALIFYFRTWRDKRGGPKAAASTVLDVIDSRGETS